MDGIGLDNMLGAEEVEKLFGGQANETSEETNSSEESAGGESPVSEEHSDTSTAEVDFSDLLGDSPESVGSGGTSEGNGEAPESNKGQGTPANLFSSIAKALRDEGVFPDLSDDALKDIKDAAAFKKFWDDQISSSLDERQKRLDKIEKMLDSGATTDEVQQYQRAVNLAEYLESPDTYNLLGKEGDDGETLRKNIMYQDYVNRGFSPERAEKIVQKSFADGTDIEDAKEAFDSCKEFYKKRIADYQDEIDRRKSELQSNQEKQYASLKKNMLDQETFFDGLKVDKSVRQKAYDSITKPVFKDEQGNYMTTLQKYQREHPIEFMQNVAMLYALTDDFKNIGKLTSGKVKEGLKKGFNELEAVLNSSRRNSDGTLNLANTPPDDREREKWNLA